MGLYDCRCMVSGVSLKGANTALVLLQKMGVNFHPIVLAIQGIYDRLGSIDCIDEDDNTKLIFDFFQEKLRSGELVVDERYLRISGYYPITDTETLLSCFERNINDHSRAAVLKGQPVVFALICRAVWETLARLHRPRGDVARQFQETFGDGPFAAEIYRGHQEKVSVQMQELMSVNTFLLDRKIAWRPADERGQDCGEEMRQYLQKARRTFSDSAVILEALTKYEREVGDLLEDD